MSEHISLSGYGQNLAALITFSVFGGIAWVVKNRCKHSRCKINSGVLSLKPMTLRLYMSALTAFPVSLCLRVLKASQFSGSRLNREYGQINRLGLPPSVVPPSLPLVALEEPGAVPHVLKKVQYFIGGPIGANSACVGVWWRRE